MTKILAGVLFGATALVSVAQSANAAVIIYTDRTAFEAALGTFQVENFADSVLVPDLSIASTAGAVSSGTFNDLSIPGVTSSTFSFASAIHGFGGNFDLPLSIPGKGLQFSITPGGPVTTQLPNTYAGGFFGFISSTAFSSVLVEAGNQTSFLPLESYVLDDLTFDARPVVPAVPEPETWLMLLTGFAACATVLRKQTRTVRVRFN
jgi:hypothetical protein